MSENKKVDITQTIIYHEDTPTLPPPRLEVGAVAWLRQNLFGSPTDIVVTILSTLFVAALVISFFEWAIGSANWFAVINNQRLFMLDRLENEFEWRVALTVLMAAFLTGMSFAVWARRSMRTLTIISLVVVALVAFMPALIRTTLPQPQSYLAAGNVEITDRASILIPQAELAFIAQAGETVEVNIATRPTSSVDQLSDLSGFSDRTANALANAAQNRIDQNKVARETFDSMISRELTESLEERTRLEIRTFVRNNDMVANTIEFATVTRDNLADETWTVAELEVWLNRLENANDGLETSDEALLTAIDDVNTTIDDLVDADTLTSDASSALGELTTTLMASESIEDIGEALVNGITIDLIGLEAQPDDAEQLIEPTPAEADFLHEMFVVLLTPQSVIDTYNVNATPMAIEILDGQTLEVLAEGVVSAEGEVVSAVMPADGWYILKKNAVEGEEGTAIVAVRGIFPIVERTLTANSSMFVRLTDNELAVTDPRPQIDGNTVPFIVLIDNQYRGLRDLTTYLVHFVPPFFEQVDHLFLPFLLVVAWGFVGGRVIAHLLGENSHFSNMTSRVTVLLAGLSPFLVVLAYFALIDGAFGIQPIGGLVGAIIKIALAIGGIFLAGQIDSWLNRMNSGEDAEASITSKLIYAWGVFPVLMYVLASGIGDFSGATLGSAVGGLIWLFIMYLAGMNYKGMLGYGLIVGGFFLQIAQTHVVDIVWDSWTDSPMDFVLIWLILAAVGVGAGLLGNSLRERIDFSSKRLGYLIGTLAFAFVFTDISIGGADTTTTAIAGFAILLWLMWMFFTGSHTWTSERIIIGLLLMTFLLMQFLTDIDKWSTIYFAMWLAVGGVMFQRGVEAQRMRRKSADDSQGSFLDNYPLPAIGGAVVVWVIALLAIPSFILGLDSSGVLATSPNQLLPLSDKRAWGGLMLTMQLTILGVGASFPIGLALALGRRSNLPVVKTACIIYIEAVRGVPLITVLFLATLLVPLIDPTLATVEGTVRVWVGVTMFSAAYLAENVRGGLQSIPSGQTEAAQAIGLSSWQTTINILLPQALRAVIPALVGQFISLFKDTSLVVIVGLAEITGIANRVVAQPEFLQRRQETYLYIAIIYFVFSYIMSYISRRVEETGSGAARARQI